MEKIPRPRISQKPRPRVTTEEIYEDYDYPQQLSSPRSFPLAAYVGIILAILLGAIIIAVSIVLSSGNMPPSLLNSEQVANNANTTAAAVPAAVPVDFELSSDYPMLGSKDAPVTLVEFADFQCPFCKEFQDTTFPEIKSKYIDTGIVKFYFAHFPFLGTESQSAAIASECARQQDKFWPYHDLLYETQGAENSNAFSDAALKGLAKQLGMNAATFAACQKDPKSAEAVAAQFSLGKKSGVGATPTVFINGQKDEGANPFEIYEHAIEQARTSQ